MSAFDAHAVLTSLRSFALLESTTGCVHYVAQPGTLTDVVVESVEHFIWAPKTLCGQIPPPRWLSISHLATRTKAVGPALPGGIGFSGSSNVSKPKPTPRTKGEKHRDEENQTRGQDRAEP